MIPGTLVQKLRDAWNGSHVICHKRIFSNIEHCRNTIRGLGKRKKEVGDQLYLGALLPKYWRQTFGRCSLSWIMMRMDVSLLWLSVWQWMAQQFVKPSDVSLSPAEFRDRYRPPTLTQGYIGYMTKVHSPNWNTIAGGRDYKMLYYHQPQQRPLWNTKIWDMKKISRFR